MTKEKSKKTLNWRLSELPTAGEVAELVDSEVITKEEAREILFTEPSSSDEKVKALEEQVDFLQGLVKQLAERNTTFVPYSRVITTPSVYWAKTQRTLGDSGLWCQTGSTVSGSNGYTLSVSGNGSTILS